MQFTSHAAASRQFTPPLHCDDAHVNRHFAPRGHFSCMSDESPWISQKPSAAQTPSHIAGTHAPGLAPSGIDIGGASTPLSRRSGFEKHAASASPNVTTTNVRTRKI
jgi:hypothetical protein